MVCPASLNGMVGLKPTVGTVPTEGVVPISASQDSPGPMARTVDEVALLYEVLAGVDGVLDRARAGVAGLRVAVARTWRTHHAATDAAFDDVVPHLAGAGAELHDVDAPVPGGRQHGDELTVLLCELADGFAAH